MPSLPAHDSDFLRDASGVRAAAVGVVGRGNDAVKDLDSLRPGPDQVCILAAERQGRRLIPRIILRCFMFPSEVKSHRT